MLMLGCIHCPTGLQKLKSGKDSNILTYSIARQPHCSLIEYARSACGECTYEIEKPKPGSCREATFRPLFLRWQDSSAGSTISTLQKIYMACCSAHWGWMSLLTRAVSTHWGWMSPLIGAECPHSPGLCRAKLSQTLLPYRNTISL